MSTGARSPPHCWPPVQLTKPYEFTTPETFPESYTPHSLATAMASTVVASAPMVSILASSSTDGSTVVWSTDTGEREAVLEYPGRNPVRVCAFSPGSSHLVSGTSDGTLWLWDFPTKTLHSE
uniref:Uncharacterized protein n=1 Tax=Hucho hucho TaxID=62062 RepID=A0A4W5RS40_9TELE